MLSATFNMAKEYVFFSFMQSTTFDRAITYVFINQKIIVTFDRIEYFLIYWFDQLLKKERRKKWKTNKHYYITIM
jgi:hypothetical protein